ncbi:MAG: response regulator [Deltaproteobacteria bacterium]|nr:response regulator [Deltaproteobacteria bacterium]
MPKSILLVDDDPETVMIVSEALAGTDFKVVQVRTLAEARSRISQRLPDLLVLDGFLPDGSGVAFIQSLRDRKIDLRVAYLSALWRDEAILGRLTGELGVCRVLHKPLGVSGLRLQIERCFEPEPVEVDEPLEALEPTPEPGRAIPWTPGAPRPPRSAPKPKTPAPPSRKKPLFAPGQPVPELGALEAQRQRLRRDSPDMRARLFDGLSDRVEELRQTLSEASQEERGGDAVLAAMELARRVERTATDIGLLSVAVSAAELRGALEAVEGGHLHLHEVLPALLDPLLLGVHAANPGERAEVADPELHLARVLLIDDEPQSFAAARAAARQRLFAIRCVRSAEEACALARAEPFDLALLRFDLHHEQGGVSAAEQLRAAHPGLPLGFLAEAWSPARRHRAAEIGAVLTAARPLTGDTLSAALRRIASPEGEPRVLLVDDDPNFTRVMTMLLGRVGVAVTAINDPERALGALTETRPDLLIVDALMPRVDGLDLCRAVRTNPAWDELPVVMLTGMSGRDVVVAGLEAGADDVLLKGIDTQELLARVRARIDRSRAARRRADRDARTGLYNRRASAEQLAARVEEARRLRRNLSVALVRLEGPAPVIDAALEPTAQALRGGLRGYDLLGRVGPTTFLATLASTPGDAATRVLRRVIEAVPGQTTDEDGLRLRLGVVCFPEDGGSPEELMRAALERVRER